MHVIAISFLNIAVCQLDDAAGCRLLKSDTQFKSQSDFSHCELIGNEFRN